MLRYRIRLVSISWVLLMMVHAYAQDPDAKITISAKNKPVGQILESIEEQTGFSFSYSSNLIDENRRLDVVASREPLQNVLENVFRTSTIAFRIIGQQIVLYEDPSKPVAEPVTEPTTQPEPVPEPKPEPASRMEREDTASGKPEPAVKVERDTVFKYINTTNVKVYDTVRYVFHDTIRHRIKSPGPELILTAGFSPLFNYPSIKPASPEYEAYTSPVKNSETPAFSYNAYLTLSMALTRSMHFTGGFYYTNYREVAEYDYDWNQPTEETRTVRTWIKELDTSYFETRERTIPVPGGGSGGKGQDGNTGNPAIQVNDTTWYYEYVKIPVDSTYSVTHNDTTSVSLNAKNRYAYLSLPLTLSWNKKLSENFFFTASTGPMIDVMLSGQGRIFNPERKDGIQNLKEAPFIKLNMSWILNAGLHYKINSRLGAGVTLNYLQGLQPVYGPDFPFKRINRSFSFSLGLSYNILGAADSSNSD